jgi:hypothetical protein
MDNAWENFKFAVKAMDTVDAVIGIALTSVSISTIVMVLGRLLSVF